MSDTNRRHGPAGDKHATGVIMVALPDGSFERIDKIDPGAFFRECPLLYHAFEHRPGKVPVADIQATSHHAVIAMVRHLTSGDYLDDNYPPSLLFHAEVFKIAEDFDVSDLRVVAYVNFLRDANLATSSGQAPHDLCACIRFLYKHLATPFHREQYSLLDYMLSYTLTVFSCQRLFQNEEFRKVVFDLPAFHKDLCKLNMERNFQDEGASDIMRLPVNYTAPHPHAEQKKQLMADLQFALLADNESDGEGRLEKKAKSKHKSKSDLSSGFMLVHKTKNPKAEPAVFSESESDSSGDDMGFKLVHPPKPVPAVNQEAPDLSSVSTGAVQPSHDVGLEDITEQVGVLAISSSEDEWDVI